MPMSRRMSMRPTLPSRLICAILALTLALPSPVVLGAEDAPADSGAKSELSFEQLASLMVERRAATEKAEAASFAPRTKDFLDRLKRNREFFEGKPDDSWKGFAKTAADAKVTTEKNEKVPYPYGKDNLAQLAMYEYAEDLSKEGQKLLDDSSLAPRERFAVLKALVTDVIIPLRSAAAIQGPDAPEFADRKFFERLLPKIPGDLFAEDSGVEKDRSMPLLEALGVRESGHPAGVAVCEYPDTDTPIELQLDPQFWLLKDATAAGAAPTKENYTRALKQMTVAMILAQMEHHKQLMGSTTPIQIPEACRSRLDGDLPEKISIKPLDEKQLQDRLDAMMEANGLSQLSPEYEHAFATQDIGDPKSKGFLGYSPFEKLHAAEAALGTKKIAIRHDEPAIDDRDSFDKLVEIRGPRLVSRIQKLNPVESSAPYRPAITSSRPAYIPPPPPTSADNERRQKKIEADMEALSSLIQTEDDARTLGPVPKALVARMDQAGATDWREVVPEAVKKKLEGTLVKLPFPPAISPPAYRTWAVRQMESFLEQAVPRLEAIEAKVRARQKLTQEEMDFQVKAIRACEAEGQFSPRPGPRCFTDPAKPSPSSAFLKDALQRIRSGKLAERASGDLAGPLNQEEIQVIEKNLTHLWNGFQDEIPGAAMSEWEFLGSQVGSNPYAGLRLETMLQKHDAEKSGNRKAAALMDAVQAEFGVDSPTLPFLANRKFSRSDRETLWTSIRDSHDADNANLFTQRGWAERQDSGIRYYEQMEKLASTRTLDRAEALSAASACHLDRQVGQKESYSKEIDELLKSDEAEKASLLKQIYASRGNRAEQDRLFEKYASEYGAEEENAGQEARKALLDADLQLKRPLYRRLIERSANQRNAELQVALTELCNLKPDDHKRFKQLVLSTMKAQEKLNEQLGLKGMPESVQEELDRWSKEDKQELALSGVALGLFVGASLLLTVSTAGLATPAVAAGASALSAAMAVGSFYVGGVTIPKMWLNEMPNAEARARYAQAFEDLRLTNRESVAKLEGEVSTMKGFGIGMNVLFSLPMIKPTATFIQGASRGVSLMTKAALAKSGTTERVALKTAATKAQKEAELIGAEYILGYRKVTWGLLKPSAMTARLAEEVSKPIQLTVKSADDVIQSSTRIYREAFRDDPARLKGFLEATKKRIAWANRMTPQGLPEAGPGRMLQRQLLHRQEATRQIDELLAAVDKHGINALGEKNELFTQFLDTVPMGFKDGFALVTIDGVPGLSTKLLHLREVGRARTTLLKELGRETTSSSAGSSGTGAALLDEFRVNLLSRGPEGESRWNLIRSEFQRTLGAKSAQEVEEILAKRPAIPAQAWQSPALREALSEMEERGRVYTNVAEFDEWLAVKRLKKEVERLRP
jgi:hypothetical protein